MTREVRFYKTTDQKCPVEVFLDSLPSKVAQKVTWTLNLIEDFDIVPKRYFSKMAGTEDLWECRIKLGSNIYRIFAFWDGGKVILTNGFAKKSQKAPSREIEKAQNYKRNHFNRKTGSQ